MFRSKDEIVKYWGDDDIAWLEEDELVCESYGDLTNYCVLAAIPYVGKKSLKNVLINYFENTPVLFEGSKIRNNGTIDVKDVVKNLENIYSKGRVTTICMLFGELNRNLMEILSDATSHKYAKEIYEKGFRDIRKRYKNKPVLLNILRSLPDDILEPERFGLMSKDELEVKVRERTITLEKLTEELEKANKELKGLDKMKSDFIDIASHELRTPMTPIKSLVQLIEEGELERMSESRRETLFRTLNSSIDRLTSTVSEMLDISRLEKVELKLEPLSMHRIVEKAIAGLAAQIEEKKHTVSMNIPKELPLVQGDRILISNLVINLLSNAVRYSPDRSSITISSHKEGNNLHTMVSDTGIGIPKDDLTEIFRPFYQVEDVEHRKSGGVGLGLNIVRGIAERHGGKVWVLSELGKGSTFHFIIPLKAVECRKKEV
ncbi:MAG: HAMP domain-containing sensor histidine kinase [Candidatus Thermoplasmatota archaeon]|jgi:signal transduction histidine kinase|nr:HAMP domain-containing sensor histidine kinase [Candidatus Thermoplasmatota archaeon]